MSNEIPEKYKGEKTYIAKTFLFVNGVGIEAGERFTVVDTLPGRQWIPIENAPPPAPIPVLDLTKPYAPTDVPMGGPAPSAKEPSKTVVPAPSGKRPSDKSAI